MDSPSRITKKFTRLNNEEMRSNEYNRKITEIDEQNFEQEKHTQFSVDNSVADKRQIFISNQGQSRQFT